MKPNRDLSNWISGNIHIDALNKAIIVTRVRGKEDVIAQLEEENDALKRETEDLRLILYGQTGWTEGEINERLALLAAEESG